MPDEISLVIKVDYSKNGVQIPVGSASPHTRDSAGNGVLRTRQLISHTTDTDLLLGSVTNQGYLHVKNVDPGNFIDLKPKSGITYGTPFARLLPNDEAWVPLHPTYLIAAKADTGDVLVELFVCDR